MKQYQYTDGDKTKSVYIAADRYLNGRIYLFMAATDGSGEVLMQITRNLDSYKLASNEVIVKAHGEGKGMVQFLQDNNIATDTGIAVRVSMILMPIMRLTNEFIQSQPSNYQHEVSTV